MIDGTIERRKKGRKEGRKEERKKERKKEIDGKKSRDTQIER